MTPNGCFYYFQSIQEAYPPTWSDSLVFQSIHHSNDLENKYLQSNLNNPIHVIAQFFITQSINIHRIS